MGSTSQFCPNCKAPLRLSIHNYWGPGDPKRHVRCPACGIWLMLPFKVRLLGALSAIAVAIGGAMSLRLLPLDTFPTYAVWGLSFGVIAVASLVGASVVRSTARWVASPAGSSG